MAKLSKLVEKIIREVSRFEANNPQYPLLEFGDDDEFEHVISAVMDYIEGDRYVTDPIARQILVNVHAHGYGSPRKSRLRKLGHEFDADFPESAGKFDAPSLKNYFKNPEDLYYFLNWEIAPKLPEIREGLGPKSGANPDTFQEYNDIMLENLRDVSPRSSPAPDSESLTEFVGSRLLNYLADFNFESPRITSDSTPDYRRYRVEDEGLPIEADPTNVVEVDFGTLRNVLRDPDRIGSERGALGSIVQFTPEVDRQVEEFFKRVAREGGDTPEQLRKTLGNIPELIARESRDILPHIDDISSSGWDLLGAKSGASDLAVIGSDRFMDITAPMPGPVNIGKLLSGIDDGPIEKPRLPYLKYFYAQDPGVVRLTGFGNAEQVDLNRQYNRDSLINLIAEHGVTSPHPEYNPNIKKKIRDLPLSTEVYLNRQPLGTISELMRIIRSE